MATFARIEQRPDPFVEGVNRWTVIQVIKVGNSVHTSDGPLGENDKHVDGENWCANFFQGGTWKQTSYNRGFRTNYAQIGGTYDYEKDWFVNRQPFASWTLDTAGEWRPPVPYPSIVSYQDNGADVAYNIFWKEEAQEWRAYDNNLPANLFTWNAETLTWDPA
jgi:hypothetical protein